MDLIGFLCFCDPAGFKMMQDEVRVKLYSMWKETKAKTSVLAKIDRKVVY